MTTTIVITTVIIITTIIIIITIIMISSLVKYQFDIWFLPVRAQVQSDAELPPGDRGN